MRKGNDLIPQIPNKANNVFSDRLRYVMRFDHISGLELANMIDAAPENISGYLTGKRYPKMERAIKIAKVLDVSLDWLCGLED